MKWLSSNDSYLTTCVSYIFIIKKAPSFLKGDSTYQNNVYPDAYYNLHLFERLILDRTHLLPRPYGSIKEVGDKKVYTPGQEGFRIRISDYYRDPITKQFADPDIVKTLRTLEKYDQVYMKWQEEDHPAESFKTTDRYVKDDPRYIKRWSLEKATFLKLEKVDGWHPYIDENLKRLNERSPQR